MGVANIDYIRGKYVDAYELDYELPYDDISVCTPLYNSTKFLKEYLSYVLMYDWPRDKTSLMFTVQGNDGTYDYMKSFSKKYGDEYRRIKVQRVKQLSGELPHVKNVVLCRKLLTKWSRPDKYVFFNDHDNFNPPVSIKRLRLALEYGADGAGGVYVFFGRNQWEPEGHIGFTAFFLNGEHMHHYSINTTGNVGNIPVEMLGRMLWVDAVAMGAFLVKREVLDNVDFFVPYGSTMTDDTAFCLKAREKGYKFIADFGLLVKHWGFDMTLRRLNPYIMEIKVDRAKEMQNRRDKMWRDGVYVHPDTDAGLNNDVKRYIDLDRIK